MEVKRAKVQNNGQTMVVKLGPEDVAVKGRSCVVQVSPSTSLCSSISKLQKRKRSDECADKCSCFRNKPILKGYEYFMKSDLPQRVLLLQGDEWTDLPPHMVALIREKFQSKNAVIEVRFDNSHFLLDIVRMLQWDVVTGEEKNIAWIDDIGRCFFPGPYSVPTTCQSHLETSPCLDNNEIKEIKLQIDVQINGSSGYDLDECVAESLPYGKSVKVKHNGACDNEHEEAIGHAKEKLAVYADYNIGQGQFIEEYTTPHHFSCDAIRDIFLSRMMSVGLTNVVNIGHCSDHLMKTRLELFEKQIEITRKCRGNPNIKYAWLASNGDASSKIMMYGPGAGGFKNLFTYGFGVHLTSMYSPHLSTRFCDDDENGIKHIVLCRVILGNVEVVDVGSKRVHPSNERFDSGVDNIENPNHYLVWKMNMNSHIFPEYMISFRMQSKVEGNVIRRQAKKSASEATVTQRVFNEKQDLMATSSSVKFPKTPWMPFRLLLDAISTGVSTDDMAAIRTNYECFRNKKITRMEFIKRLRMIVDDELLRSTITSYRESQPPHPGAACYMKVQKLNQQEP